MKRFRFLSVFLLALLLLPVNLGRAQTVGGQFATVGDWYRSLDQSLDWPAMMIPLDNVPAFSADTALLRAYALGIAWDTDPSSYAYPVTYGKVGSDLQELLFPDSKSYGDYTVDPWNSVKWRLVSFGINIDSLEAAARGVQYYYTNGTDVVSKTVLTTLALLLVKVPLITMPVIETTIGDTAVTFLQYRSDSPLRGFRTILTDIPTGSLNVLAANGDFSPQFQKGILFHTPYYSVDEFAIDGMMGGAKWETTLGALVLTVPNTSQFSVYQRGAYVSDNNGNDSPVLGEKTLVFSYDRADVNKNFAVSTGDAIAMSNMLLRDDAFYPVHLGDVNYNGVQDPDDVTGIMQAALWTGGTGGGMGKASATVASASAASADGKLVFGRTADGYTVSFAGNLASKRLALSLSFDPAAKFENVAYDQKTIVGVTGCYYKNGKLNVLMYSDSLAAGNLLEVSFSGVVPDVKVSPLGANYFADGEKIDVVNNSVTGVVNDAETPNTFGLSQNYPNPFNPSTAIRFELKSSAFVVLKVYNMLGQEMRTLVNGTKPAGTYEVMFDASGLPSGIYVYSIQAGDFVATRKMILLK